MGWKFFSAAGAVKGVGAAGATGAAGADGSNKVTYIWMSKPTGINGLGRRFYADRAMTIDHVFVWATDSAPTSTLVVDVYKNGASIYPSSTKPNLTATNFLSSDFTPDTTGVVAGDKLEVYVSSVGGATGRIGVAIVGTYT